MLHERGVDVNKTTILQWIRKYATSTTEFKQSIVNQIDFVGHWNHIEETAVKRQRDTPYLYRAIDQKCIATDLMLSHGKDIQAPMLKPEISTQYYHKIRKFHDSLLLDHLVNSNYSFYVQMHA